LRIFTVRKQDAAMKSKHRKTLQALFEDPVKSLRRFLIEAGVQP
jgi:hypothetical protein